MTTINLITTSSTFFLNNLQHSTAMADAALADAKATNTKLASRMYFDADELVHGIKDTMVVNWESGSIVVGNCEKGHVFVIHYDRMLWDREHVIERMSMYQAICMVAKEMQEYDYTLWRDHHCVIQVEGEAFLTCC